MMEEKLCRLCGSEDGIFVNIFEKGADRVRKIHKTLPIMVDEHDPFPKQICHHCSYKIDEFYEFRRTSIRTHEILRKKVPWLKENPPSWRFMDLPPMVEVELNSIDAISPSEKQISPSAGSVCEEDEDDAILIEDSPPYIEHSNYRNPLVSGNKHNEHNPTDTIKSKKSKSKYPSEKKKKKKKDRKRRREVFANEQECQNLNNNIENDPLRPSPIDNIENNSFDNIVDNSSCVVKSPKSELCVMEKGILTDDKGGGNIAFPKFILITKIPQVGNIYTCEKCGTTFLNPQRASQHPCVAGVTVAVAVEENSPKEDVQHDHENQQHDFNVINNENQHETDQGENFYQCSECSDVFTRHSQLVSHRRKHVYQVDSSSDDSCKPFNKRKRHHSKKKHKRLLNTSNFNPTGNFESNTTTPNYLFNLDLVETNITRHSLLSSDSE